MGKIFKSPKPPEPPPPPPPPPVIPMADEDALRKKKAKGIAASRAKSGRQSTILSEAEDTMGA